MAINYSIDAQARVVGLTYVSEPTIEELTATLRAIFRSTDYRPGFGFLVDRRTIAPPTRAFVEELLAFMTLQRAALAGGRWALVFSDAAGYDMGRIQQEVVEGRSGPVLVRPFRHVQQAEAWLRETDPEK